MSLTAFLVDDEPAGRRRLRQMLANHADVEITGEFGDVASARGALREGPPDLVFLDIQMPVEDGFALFEGLLPEQRPAVVFVTAHDRYAVRAFDVDAVDYLLKPFDAERFALAMKRVREAVTSRAQRGVHERLRHLLGSNFLEQGAYPERLAVRQAGRVSFLTVSEIDWIDAAHNQCRVHAGGKTYLLREPISEVEKKLDPRRFQRVHRSTLVNLDSVREMVLTEGGQNLLILPGGQKLSLSRSYRERIRAHLGLGA